MGLADRFMTPSGKLPYRIEVRDDHGFSALRLEMTKLLATRTASGEEPAMERLDLRWTEERGDNDSGGVKATVGGELDQSLRVLKEVVDDHAVLVFRYRFSPNT